MSRTTIPSTSPTFALDTSGFVDMRAYASHEKRIFPQTIWSDLDPFTQGYIEAAWEAVRELRRDAEDRVQMNLEDLGFRHLAPEALALILKDCAAYCALPMRTGYAAGRYHGRNFWDQRSRGLFCNIGIGFPPLTPYLRADGKVDLKESTPR